MFGSSPIGFHYIAKRKLPFGCTINIHKHLFHQRWPDLKLIQESQAKRFKDPSIVENAILRDAEWRHAQRSLDAINKQINDTSKSFSNIRKQMNEPNDENDENDEILKLKKLSKDFGIDQKRLKTEELFLQTGKESAFKLIGNIVHESVPVSNDKECNEIICEWETMNGKKRNMNHKLHHHHQLLHMIGGYEPEKGVQVCGHRGYFLTGPGVILNMALQNYGIQFLLKKNYTPVYPPYFMNKDLMANASQLEDIEESLYHVLTGDNSEMEKYLIATSEQPISALHFNEFLTPAQLPIKYAGISTCFRKEAGAHGKDAWGIFRVHQFDKIEQFVFCAPNESWEMHERMIEISQAFYESLHIPYRVVNIVSGELNNAAAKKYDLEGWFPTLERYRELVSASNCTDYQAIAMNTRFGYPVKINEQKQKKEWVHMLNATLCATTRTICAILENFQTDDGIVVPEVLVSYCGGMSFIPFVRKPLSKDENTK